MVAILLQQNMPRQVALACAWMLLLLLGPLHPVWGQAEPADPSNILKAGATMPDILSDGTLDATARLWFSDKDGSRVFVPGESYEEYYLRSNGQASGGGLPTAALERVQVEIDVRGDVAHVEGLFEVLLSQENATQVDLRLGAVQLSEWSFSDAAEKNLIQPAVEEPGWRWLLLGLPGTARSVTLKGVSRVSRETDQVSLRVSLPSAPCTVQLRLPPNAVDIRVRAEDVMQRTESAEAVQLTVNSSGGEFTVSWRDQAAVSQVAAVKASSSTEFDITDPTQPWMAKTELTIRWHGQESSSQVRLELPPGAQWRSVPYTEFERYRISVWEEPPAAATPADTEKNSPAEKPPSPKASEEPADSQDSQPAAGKALQLVLENLDVARNETIVVPLDWEWTPPSPEEEMLATEVKLPAPRIHGVDQHEGTIDCVIPASYSVVFKEGAGGKLLHQGAVVEKFGQQQLRFEFDRQAFDLSLVFRREQSLPTVRPAYVVHVDRHKLLLTMWFDCSFDTSQQPMELGLILDEWLIQENTARVVDDPTNPFSSTGEVLRVRQVDRNYVISGNPGDAGGYGSSRHVEQVWRVVAERSWAPEDNELYLQVPSIVRGGLNGQPETDHGSGVLLVASDSDVLLQWQEAASTGLQRDSFSSEYQRYVVGERPRKPLAYRFQSGGSSPPAWAGMARMLPQQITLEQHVDLDVVASQLAIRQNFELQVANEPLSELRFAVRKDVADVQPPQVYVNGNLVSSTPLETISESSLQALQRPIVGPLPDTPTPNSPSNSVVQADQAPTSDGATWQTYQLIGNHPQFLGATRLTILSNQLWKAGEKSSGGEEAGTTLSVPLAQLLLPGEARHLRQDWTLRTDLEVEAVHSAESGFSQDTLVGGLRIRPLAEKQREIQLSLRPRRMLGMPPVRIGKSWLQTFVTGRTRRDRFVVQVETSSDELQLKLPEKANIREKKVMVSVDGFEQPYHYEPSTDIVTIALPSSGRGEHVIEISYLLPDALTWVSKLTVAPPQILGAEQIEKFYWQLLTPSVQHLGWSPTELTAEWTWDWAGLWWKRDSLWDQRRLEAWIGTEVQESPPASANSYVMSGRGPDKAVNVWVLSRFVLWFPVGAFAIALSFTVLNFPPVRRPIFVFALAGVIAGLAMVWPDMAMLAGQTAVLSLGLVALVWVVQAAVDSRVRRRSVFTTRPSSTFMERSDYYSGSRGARTPQPTVTHVGSSIGGSAE